MAEIKFSQLTTAAQLTNDDIFALAQMQGGSLSSVKTSMIAVANFLNTQVQYTTAYNTQAKTTAGAINELKQLISLIPQFAIEVVEELPTEDISDTTIYLVPAEDPEVGNYYEEYIHVNDSWELVGTTAVDLSAYYTKLEVDGLLATKASVAEVALKENKSDMPTDVRTIIKDCKTPKNATITNGIAQFECIEENLVKALKVTMNPIQSGSGDTSPTNIRPISGRTELGVKRTGKNLFDGVYSGISSSLTYRSIYLGNGTFTMSTNCPRTSGNTANIFFLAGQVTSGADTDANGVWDNKSITQTAVNGYVTVAYRNANSVDTSNYNVQIELGSVKSTFEPYQGETHTHQYSETIYGGTDDFVNGGATVNFGFITLDDSADWSEYQSGKYFVNAIAVDEASLVPIGEEYISNMYTFSGNGNSSSSAIREDKRFYGQRNFGRFWVYDSSLPTLADFKAMLAVTPLQIAYPLATPTTIETSAEDITTVAGTNIISGTEPISECKYTELATVDDLIKIIGGQ